MALKNVVRRTADSTNALGANEPQKESEKVTIPADGEVRLQNTNVLPDSLSVVEIKTELEFEESQDQTFGAGKYFFLPEESTLFFDPADAGRRVRIDYLWTELSAETEEDEEEEPNVGPKELDDDLGFSEDEEEKETKSTRGKPHNPWSLEADWFKWKPLTRKISVNNSLRAKLETNVDLGKGLKVKNEESGKELKVVLTSSDKNGNPKRRPGPGEVVYNYTNGFLYWYDQTSSGKTYEVEYFLKGQQAEKVTLEGEENEEKEYQIVEKLKSRAENLWTNLLDNPDPAFVQDTLLPIIESEIDSLRSSILAQSNELKKEKELKDVPDLTGEFMELERLLTRRQESDDEDARQTARMFIESEISPKLSRFYSLASLLAERIYDMQTASAEKDEDFPEFGSEGARVLDPQTLKYLKRVRQEASKIDEDIVDFSKFFTGLLIKWITDPETYMPSGRAPDEGDPKKKKKKDSRWDSIKEVFDSSGIGLADLQSVALEAFRRAILEFDREKRNKEKTPDPKKFRVYANPVIKNRVENALKSLFDKYQREQQVESRTTAGTSSFEIPKDGSEYDLGTKGLRVEDLTIKSKSTGVVFTPADAKLLQTQEEGRKSRKVKIPLGVGKMSSTAQVSVTDPETGNKLEVLRATGPWTAELTKKIKEDPSICYFASSSGILWLSDKYRGKSLLVEAPGIEGEGPVGKDQYRVFPTRGTIQFSPQNAGERVDVTYSQTRKVKRQVSPVVKTRGRDDEGEEVSLIENIGEEQAGGADPQSQAEEALSNENVDRLLDVIRQVLEAEEDPRLSSKERTLLSGILGLSEPGGQRLSIQEVASRPPFNATSSLDVNQVKKLRQEAANTLLLILKEKAQDNPKLEKMVQPLGIALMGKDLKGPIADDKFYDYIRSLSTEADGPKKAKSFRGLLSGMLGKIRLKEGEENLLRWMWTLPGKLRRDPGDEGEEGKKYETVPEGFDKATQNIGERLQQIAVDEFGIEPDDDGSISQAATNTVAKVYERAVEKFTKAFDTYYAAKKDFFVEHVPDFVGFYDPQRGKQSLRDELLSIDSGESLPARSAPSRIKREPLYDQLKKSIRGADEGMLKSLMEELLATHKKGGSINDLISQRQKDVDQQLAKGATLLEKKTKDIRGQLQELRDALGQTQKQIAKLEDDKSDTAKARESVGTKIVSESSEEYQKEFASKKAELHLLQDLLRAARSGSTSALFAKGSSDPQTQEILDNYSYLKDADGDELAEAADDLATEIKEKKAAFAALRKKIMSLASSEYRKELRALNQKAEEIEATLAKFKELLSNQEVEEEAKKKALNEVLKPLEKKVNEHVRGHNSNKELQTLQQVYNYLSDNEEWQRGDGSFSLDDMFEVSKPEKSKGYKPPASTPESEDDWQPAPRSDVNLEAKEPTPVTEPTSTLQRNLRPPSGNRELIDEERMQFTPREKDVPTETQVSLFDELRSVALPIDPEETRKAYEARVKNFRVLMRALRQHFADGKSVKEFKPSLPAEQTLPDQNKVLRDAVYFLRDFRQDLHKGPGVWDLTNLFTPGTVSKQVRSLDDIKKLTTKPDLTNAESAIEALTNAQPSLNKASATVLYHVMNRINEGEDIKKLFKNISKEHRNLILYLAHFMSKHADEGMKGEDGKWDFSYLFSGDRKLPTREEYTRALPLDKQMGPLVLSIRREMQEEAGPGGGIENSSATEERVQSMLHQMSELAMSGMDLDQMSTFFEQEDSRQAKPYSLVFLFQRVRNYLSRLNRTQGLSNSKNDLGLSSLFGEGAPQAEKVTEPEKKEEVQPMDVYTPTFRRLIEERSLSEAAAGVLHKLSIALQRNMENSDRTAEEVLEQLVRQLPKYEKAVSILKSFIGKNRKQFDSGIIGVPDLSSLTGLPFKNHITEPAPEAEVEVPTVTEILKEKVTPVKGEERTKLRKSIFDEFAREYDLDENLKNMYADALRLLKSNAIGGDMAAEGARGAIERLVTKTQGTELEGVFELILEFFREKGLVMPDGLPDFRGVSIPPLGSRPPYFDRDGKPSTKAIEQEEDLAAKMPEPKVLSEDVDEEEQTPKAPGKLSPKLEDAVEFLKSDQAVETTPKEKKRREKKVFDVLMKDFDVDPEERQNVIELLSLIQTRGLAAVRDSVKGQGYPEVLFDDVLEFLKDQGLTESDISNIELPATKEKAAPAKRAPKKLKPTPRHKVSDDVIRQTLEEAKATQGKGFVADTFDVADVVKSLEGKVSPADAKNALLQAMEAGLVELRPEAGNSVFEGEIKFVPVPEDGIPLTSGKVLRMPEQTTAPAPATSPAPKRGRLPSELVNRQPSPGLFHFVVQHAKLSEEDAASLAKTLPGIEAMTYGQIANKLLKGNLPEESKDLVKRFLTTLTSYLRLVESGKDPLVKAETPLKTQRPKGEWKSDPATENQVRKIKELSEALKAQGQEVGTGLPKTKGEAADLINSLMGQLDAMKQQPSTVPPRPQAPVPQPTSLSDNEKLRKVRDAALDWFEKSGEKDARVFKLVLTRANKKEWIPLYESIMAEVQKTLNATHDDNFFGSLKLLD